jgi:hypothetical protein
MKQKLGGDYYFNHFPNGSGQDSFSYFSLVHINEVISPQTLANGYAWAMFALGHDSFSFRKIENKYLKDSGWFLICILQIMCAHIHMHR